MDNTINKTPSPCGEGGGGVFKYFPHTSADVQSMLDVIGVKSLDELYAEIPEELKFRGELDLPSSMSESEVRANLQKVANSNDNLVCFAGQGSYDHYTPAVVPFIASRSEFSTSYTPYQAEISQGTLQYIFEYQTMMCRLTGLDVSNASMYDGSTATAEAMMMCVASAKKRNKVLISDTFLPSVMDVVKTYAHFHGVDLVVVPAKKRSECSENSESSEGITDLEAIKRLLEADDVAGVIVPQPNRYGLIESFEGLADACHAHKALLAINTMATALSVLKTPAEWGADIACGDAQSLGIPVSYGGPYIGYLCTTNALIRKMPGRLVGQTVDQNGQRCFVLTMQAREQHIRREKATSNICTAQGFMCLYVACYLSLMGAKGLREVNEKSYTNAHLLHDKLMETGLFEEAFPGKAFLNEFTLKWKSNTLTVDEMREEVAEEGFLAGATVCNECGLIAFAATEERTEDEINELVEIIKEVAQ